MPEPTQTDSAQLSENEPAVPLAEHLREMARGLRLRLYVVAALSGPAAFLLIYGSFNGSVKKHLPEWIVFLFQQLAVGLLVAGAAAILAPWILPSKKLQETLIDYLKKDVSRAIDDQTAKIEGQTKRLVQRAASLAAIQDVGITRVYPSREKADDDIAAALANSREIRLIGLSLNDSFNTHGPFKKTWSAIKSHIVSGSSDVRILLADPRTLGAELRAESQQSSGKTSSLKHDVDDAVKELRRLERQTHGGSFDFRLYRVSPQLFLCQTDSVAFVQPYYFRQTSGNIRLPIVRCVGKDLLDDFRNHFDLIWRFASVSPDEYLDGRLVGIERGASRTAIASILSERGEAADRMRWLIEERSRRFAEREDRPDLKDALKVGIPKTESSDEDEPGLWLQGISLDSFFDDERLHDALDGPVQEGVDVRVLVLHPYSRQAYVRSYSEHYANDKTIAFPDYCAGRLHDESSLVRDIHDTIRKVLALRRVHGNVQVHLYASSPFCFMLLTDDTAMVEQYHYGKLDQQQRKARRGDIKDMPILEYKRNAEGPPGWVGYPPFDLLVKHFKFAWRLAMPAMMDDLDSVKGRERAQALEVSALAPPAP